MQIHRPMLWTMVVLSVTIAFMVVSVAVQLVLPHIQAESLAKRIAPQFDVDENSLRKVLTDELSKGVELRMLVIASPFLILSGLLFVRIIAERHEVTALYKKDANRKDR